MGVYVPEVIDRDGKSTFKGYVFAVADVSDEDLVQLEDKDTAKANLKDRNYYLNWITGRLGHV